MNEAKRFIWFLLSEKLMFVVVERMTVVAGA
jgi:hypothetical protein